MAQGAQGVIENEVLNAMKRIVAAINECQEQDEVHREYLKQLAIFREANDIDSDDEHASMQAISWDEESAREQVMRAMGMAHVHAELHLLLARRQLQDMLEFQSKHRTKKMVKSFKSWVALKKAMDELIADEGIDAAEYIIEVVKELRNTYRSARHAMEDALSAEFESREAKKKESKTFEGAIKKVLRRHVYPRLLPQSAAVRKSIAEIAIQEVLMKVDCGDEVEIIVACDCDGALC